MTLSISSFSSFFPPIGGFMLQQRVLQNVITCHKKSREKFKDTGYFSINLIKLPFSSKVEPRLEMLSHKLLARTKIVLSCNNLMQRQCDWNSELLQIFQTIRAERFGGISRRKWQQLTNMLDWLLLGSVYPWSTVLGYLTCWWVGMSNTRWRQNVQSLSQQDFRWTKVQLFAI